jgi:hypothetical protein
MQWACLDSNQGPLPYQRSALNRLSYKPICKKRPQQLRSDRKTRDSGLAASTGARPAPWAGFPRKEVIQPQLPLQLPCYDFVPVTSPTLDGCLPCGLAHRLQVLPAPMT